MAKPEDLDDLVQLIADDVRAAMGEPDADERMQMLRDVAIAAFTLAYGETGGGPAGATHATPFAGSLGPAIALLKPDGSEGQPERTAQMIAHAALNAATAAAGTPDTKFEWRTQRDDRVRDLHQPLDGQVRAAGEPFDVGGQPLMYPGHPVGPPEGWINCRCFLQRADKPLTAAAPEHHSVVVVARPADPASIAVEGGLPPEELHVTLGFYGPLADLDPEIARLLEVFVTRSALQTEAQISGRGVLGNDDPQAVVLFVEAPALAQARSVLEKVAAPDRTHPHFNPHMTLGYGIPVPDTHADSVSLDGLELWKGDERIPGPRAADVPRETVEDEPEDMVARAFSTDERDKLADKGQAMPDGSFPIANEEDLRNAIQAIGRAKDPEAARAHIRKRARALGLAELIPESWTASVKETADSFTSDVSHESPLVAAPGTHDAPGWITNPRETQRLRTYWTKGEGAAKIGWGTPNDLTRCASYLSEYVEPNYVWGTCQNLHFEALGYWNPESEGGHASLADINAAITAAFVTAHDLEEPMPPPRALFEDPQLTGPTPQTLRAAGDYVEYVGHLAAWETCHVGISGECVQPPRTASGYAHFRLGEVETDDGFVSVGHITMGTGHAATNLSASDTVAHYDNSGTVIADVAVGEDDYGIWAHGIARPGITEDQLHAARAGVPSGDWRRIGGTLELVAALIVNVPGFPIARPELAASAGRELALVAAGVVTIDPNAFDDDRMVLAVSRALDEREARAARALRAAALTETVKTERVSRLLQLVGE